MPASDLPWHTRPAKPHTALGEQFEPFTDEDATLGKDRGPQRHEYNHGDDYEHDRRRWESAQRSGRTYVDTDRRRLKAEAKIRDEETSAPYIEEHEHEQRRKQMVSDIGHVAGGTLLFAAGILPVLRRENDVPVISKVAR
jgi:hypothetical protein